MRIALRSKDRIPAVELLRFRKYVFLAAAEGRLSALALTPLGVYPTHIREKVIIPWPPKSAIAELMLFCNFLFVSLSGRDSINLFASSSCLCTGDVLGKLIVTCNSLSQYGHFMMRIPPFVLYHLGLLTPSIKTSDCYA